MDLNIWNVLYEKCACSLKAFAHSYGFSHSWENCCYHCSTFKKNFEKRPTMWAVFRPQQEHGSHQLWERGQGDGGKWARRLGSSPFILCLSSPPMMLFRKHTMVDTCVLSERTLLLFMCSAEGRKKARGAVKQAKAMLPHSISLSFFLFLPFSFPLSIYVSSPVSEFKPRVNLVWSHPSAFLSSRQLEGFLVTPEQSSPVKATNEV